MERSRRVPGQSLATPRTPRLAQVSITYRRSSRAPPSTPSTLLGPSSSGLGRSNVANREQQRIHACRVFFCKEKGVHLYESEIIGCSPLFQQPTAASLYRESYAKLMNAAAFWLQPALMNFDVFPNLRIDNRRQSVICGTLRYLALLSSSNPHNIIAYIKC